MTAAAAAFPAAAPGPGAGRWAAAFAVAAALHLGLGAGALMRWTPAPAEPAPEAAAVMIDFAPLPTAPASEASDAAPAVEAATAAADALEPLEPDEVQAEPSTDDVLEVPPEKRAAETAALTAERAPVEAVVAAAPPERPAREDAKPRPAESRPKSQRARPAPTPARETTAAPKVNAPRSERVAASSPGVASAVAPADWTNRVLAQINRHKRYPLPAKSRREEGVAYVRITIDRAGVVQAAELARGTGHADLDREAVAVTRRASPLPAPPAEVRSLKILAPVSFSLRS
ncbi:energy transducer TonB [Methylopila sp. 73B]|uniref:energy transducer TonB family protein n=1 Tax=Methylopila sp. 73B TaxID=1120792 RepID=UPI000364280B|nr:energy transducer TonB [Methylopila sp. 73B]